MDADIGRRLTGRVPAPLVALAAMVSVQLGAALSTHLFAALSPAGSAWLRLSVAAAALLALTRPRPRDFSRAAVGGVLALGTTSALMTLAFVEALDRIPLGTAVAIEFLGPLGVAAARAHRRSALLWPLLAALGVLGLTQPWAGRPDAAGIGGAWVARTASPGRPGPWSGGRRRSRGRRTRPRSRPPAGGDPSSGTPGGVRRAATTDRATAPGRRAAAAPRRRPGRPGPAGRDDRHLQRAGQRRLADRAGPAGRPRVGWRRSAPAWPAPRPPPPGSRCARTARRG